MPSRPTSCRLPQGADAACPLVQVFTAEGTLIFQEDGYTLGMNKRLRQALEKKQPVSGGVSLADQLRELRTFDGKTVEASDLPPSTFIVIDHWAIWCSACKPQMKLLEGVATDPKTPGVLLLKVNWDQIQQ